MILTCEQLRPLLRGTAEIIEKDGRLQPLRFGKYVRESVYGEGNRFHGSTYHASGATLDFVTDSRRFALSFTLTNAGSHTMDAFIDGVMVQHLNCKSTGTLVLDIPEGEHRVTVYLPHHATCELYGMELDDGASFAPAPAPDCRILFAGDSITHGSTSAFASMTYPHQVARALNAEIFNQGISGAFFNPYVVDDELAAELDMVVLAFGTNDWSLTTRGILVGAVNGHLARLRDKYPDIPIVALLPLWRADHTRVTAVGTFEDMREIIRKAAARCDVQVIDGVELIPHVPSVFADSRLHPNALGFQFYAEELVKRLPKVGKANEQ